jgi:hypothetical protein
MNTIKIKSILSKNSTASLVTALSLHEILRIILKNINAVCALELTNDEKRNKTYLTQS